MSCPGRCQNYGYMGTDGTSQRGQRHESASGQVHWPEEGGALVGSWHSAKSVARAPEKLGRKHERKRRARRQRPSETFELRGPTTATRL